MNNADDDVEDYVLNFLSHWVDVVNALWLLMSFCALLAAGVPQLSCVGVHGKRSTANKPHISVDPNWIAKFTVPKRYFMHFYVIGSSLSVLLLIWMVFRPYHLKLLTVTLFLIHCIRRLWECMTLTEFGDSVMHIGGYLVGLVHYILVPLSLLIVAGEEKISHTHHFLLLGLRRNDSLRTLIVILIYALSSALQFHSHRTLYTLKRKQLKDEHSVEQSDRYSIPSGGGFEYCCCPHYLAEIGIYLALTISAPHCKTMYYLLAWVITNLSVVAYKQFSWYIERFPEEVEKRRLSALFPFLW